MRIVRPIGQGGVRVLRMGGPLGLLFGMVSLVVFAMVAVLSLGVALLFLRGRRAARKVTGAPPPTPLRERSTAEVLEGWVLAPVLALGLLGAGVAEAKILVPMDDAQTDHLKAYGLTFWALQKGQRAEWLLNYRGGSFLLGDDTAV